MEKIGFLFAGQGSQYVGMGKDLYESFPESKAIFDKANEVLDFDLKTRCFRGPGDLLKLTVISQPAILTVSIAAYQAFKARIDITPSFLAGLSLGEYTALIAAGSLAFVDGLRLVKRRAEIMEDASRKHPGKMAAVLDLPFDKVKDICFQSHAEIANINAPGQTVISGAIEAVDKARALCIETGAKRVIDLEVSGGFHSSLMSEASVDLKMFLDNTAMFPPLIPVISNYTARPQYKVAQIQENLVYQMRSSVKWEDSMRFLLSQGVSTFFEFGPGKVLKGLMRRISEEAKVINIEKKEDILNLENRNQ
jgi:[acyl-carrier-protein] S-malonyltransferase